MTIEELKAAESRYWHALTYIAGGPCECQKDGARLYHLQETTRAACVGCLARHALGRPVPERT